MTAATNTKGYDGTTTASATPTVTGGLVSGDTAVFTETYDTKTWDRTLTASGFVNDGNSGNNYTIHIREHDGHDQSACDHGDGDRHTKVYDGRPHADVQVTGGRSSAATASARATSRAAGKTLTATPFCRGH